MDSSENQNQATNQSDDAGVKDAFKNNPLAGLPTPDETPRAGLGEPPSLPTKSLNTSATKPHYVMVPVEEAEPKKKQSMRHQAYLTDVNQQIHSNKFSPQPKNWKELLSYLYKLILRKGSSLTEGSSRGIFNSTPYQDS